MVTIGDIDIIGVDIDIARFRWLTDIDDFVRCRLLLADLFDRPLIGCPPLAIQGPASDQQECRVDAYTGRPAERSRAVIDNASVGSYI